MPDGDRSRFGLIDVAIEPRSKADQEKLSRALAQLAREDPTFCVKSDAESGQTILSGTSELHLDIIVERLKREFGVSANIGAPQVAYRETITKPVEHDYTHKKAGQFARVKYRIEPAPVNAFAVVARDALPVPYLVSIEKSVASFLRAGPLIGFPIVGVRFVLTGGASHDADSSELVFEIATHAGLREAFEKAGPRILEPIMLVEITTPENHVGDIIGDLNSRRGQIRAAESRGLTQSITAQVPLANMFGYVSSLRALSRGLAQYTMVFDHYHHVPDPVGPHGGDDRFPPGAMAPRA